MDVILDLELLYFYVNGTCEFSYHFLMNVLAANDVCKHCLKSCLSKVVTGRIHHCVQLPGCDCMNSTAHLCPCSM